MEEKIMNYELINTTRNDEKGSIGIGAMIVFIALILVAAVASTVIIKTAEELQDRAEKTGDDTRDQISGKLLVTDAYIGADCTYGAAPGAANAFDTDCVDADDAVRAASSDGDIDMIIVIAKLASGSDNTLPTSMSYTIACDNGAGAFATDHSLLSGADDDADVLHDADIRTMAGVDITDTTALASGEQFKFSIHTTNCDDVAVVGGSLSLTLNVQGGGDTRLDLEIETVAIGDKLI
jgi:archaellin